MNLSRDLSGMNSYLQNFRSFRIETEYDVADGFGAKGAML